MCAVQMTMQHDVAHLKRQGETIAGDAIGIDLFINMTVLWSSEAKHQDRHDINAEIEFDDLLYRDRAAAGSMMLMQKFICLSA